MTVKFFILNERVKYLTKELGSSLTVLKVDDSFTQVEITFTDGSEVLQLFHAGVYAGLDIAHNIRVESI